MKPTIKKKLIKALRSGDYLLNLKDKAAPLCEVLPNGDHRFSPAGVLCDLAPKEVADWLLNGPEVCANREWLCVPSEVDRWCGRIIWTYEINGHRTLAATIKAIEEL